MFLLHIGKYTPLKINLTKYWCDVE